MTTRKSIRGSHIGKPRICVRLQLVQSNHCFIIVLFFRSSSTYNPHINHGGQDTLSKIFFRLQYFCPDLRLARTKTAIPIRSVKNADCRLQTGYKMQTKYKCRLQTENLYFFFVWYEITSHLTTYRASRNRFSAILYHDYLHYCGIFLARFLITIVLNIVSSLHIVFSLCARVSWCDV